ncbi:hypothetical protein HanPSC8_Chr10g0423291 [Helianthus annuus]|nr:hypothetical protein HanPSC8_Chr10g0423291 [Helianthus annuus]
MLVSVLLSLRSKFPPFTQHNEWYHRFTIHMSRRGVSHYQVTRVSSVSCHTSYECVTTKGVMHKLNGRRTLRSGAECHDRFFEGIWL